MLFRTHAALGVLIGILAMNSFNYSPVVFLICVFASLLPDIDSAKSFIGNRFYLRPVQWIVKHRGFFHSLTACVVFTIMVWTFKPLYSFSFFAGYASHLLLDSITTDGITPFWPMKHKTEGAFSTGTVFEMLVFALLCAGSFLALITMIF